MTRQRATALTLALAAAIALASSTAIGAREQTKSGQRGSASTAIATRNLHGNPQGFSVILVVGDLQGTPGDGDVPPAARQALNDMKDFLPYKSYKLLDAAWILSSFTRSTTRLRGPEEREFEIDISASPVASTKDSPDAPNRINVQFSLRDVAPDTEDSPGGRPAGRVNQERVNQEAEAHAQLAEAEAALKAARDRLNAGTGTREEVQRAEQNVSLMRERLNKTARVASSRTLAREKLADRAMMNTTFTMDVGETVVVGTSRLRSNSKALIALLTAVPQRVSRGRQ
jgi:hypothetical protein